MTQSARSFSTRPDMSARTSGEARSTSRTSCRRGERKEIPTVAPAVGRPTHSMTHAYELSSKQATNTRLYSSEAPSRAPFALEATSMNRAIEVFCLLRRGTETVINTPINMGISLHFRRNGLIATRRIRHASTECNFANSAILVSVAWCASGLRALIDFLHVGRPVSGG